MSEAAVVSEIRRWHPLFKHLSSQGARMMFKHAKVLFVRPLQVLFKENEQHNTILIPLYGRVLLRGPSNVPVLVDSSGSLGEEAICMSGYMGNYMFRLEAAVVESEGCLLTFNAKVIEELKLWFAKQGLKSDYIALITFLKKSFAKKQGWRKLKQ